MPRENRQPFSYGEYTVRKTFKGWGGTWKPGSVFPWRQLTCTKSKLRQLYDQGYIEPKGNGDSAVTTPEIVTEIEETVTEVPQESGPFVFNPDVHTIQNPERGEWCITKGKTILLHITAKEARRLEKRVTSTEVRAEEIVEEETIEEE